MSAFVWLGLVVSLSAQAPAEQSKPPAYQWRASYIHDEDKSTLTIFGLQFVSPAHGMALATLAEKKGKSRDVGVLTFDAGKRWELVKLPDGARSLFFLDPANAWIVSEGGIHKSVDGGRTWRRVGKLRNAVRVHFLTPAHGFAVGAPKKIWQTEDGGKTWRDVPAAANPKSNAERSIYTWIEFVTPQFGIFGGFHEPERRDRGRYPDWMDPERARTRRQWPSLTLLVQTSDAGKTWNASASSIMGKISRYKALPSGAGLSLVEFEESFEWPSEVYRLDVNKGLTERTFREKDRAITDIAVMPNGIGYLAGYEPAGALSRLPVPGKVKILRSADLVKWTEMDVDYRAVARRVWLSANGGAGAWAATDTGMILQLTAVASNSSN